MKTKRDLLNSAKIREKKRKARLRKIVFFSSLFVILLVGGALLTHLPAFAITEVSVSGAKVVPSDVITQSAKEKLGGNYLHLFSRRNALLYPRRAIHAAVMASSPRVKDAKISRLSRHSLSVSITEFIPAYLWCGTVESADAVEQCFFLDSTGYVFSEAPYFSGDVYFKFFGTLEGNGGIGSRFLDPDTLATAHAASQSFRTKGFVPYALSVTDAGDYALSVESKGRAPSAYPKILFRPQNDFPTIEKNLAAALAAEPLASKMKDDADALEYIDLRYDNKVYYKFNE